MALDRKLIWEDTFETEGLPNAEKWTYEHGFVRNQENQFYTIGRKENARVENGRLIFEAHREKIANPAHHPDAPASDWVRQRRWIDYTSASIGTRHSASWLYGSFEVRAKVPMPGPPKTEPLPMRGFWVK